MSNKYPCVYYDHRKCQKFSDDQYTAWCDFDQCEFITPSNADHIRSMTDEELAKHFRGGDICQYIGLFDYAWCDRRLNCKNCVIEWLKQPYKE